MRTILLFLVALSFSCTPYSSEIEDALKQAGSNRDELETVLSHYSHNPSDSLKLRAAEFLIANMPGHFSYADDRISGYYSEIDTVLTNPAMTPTEKMGIIERITARYPGLDTIEDIKIIKADFLIRNIEQAFRDWKGQRMFWHVTFDQFCEFMLPYKVTELQQLDDWRDSLRGKYSKRYRTESVPSRLQFSVYNAANLINAEINSSFPQNHIAGDYYRFLSASNIDKMPFGQCDEYSILAMAILRSEGIPIVREELTQWGNKPAGHSWYSMLNSDGNIFPFYWGLQVAPGAPFYTDEPVPKVYRYTYTRNERPHNYLKNCEDIPLFVDVFKKDITAEYIATSKLSIPITGKRYQKCKWAYIAVFDDKKWVLVDYGEMKNKKAIFENMGRNIVYLVFGYQDQELEPISAPFILHTDGAIEYLIPDSSRQRRISLTRKYPMTDHTLKMEQRLVGGKIEASKTADFSNSVTFYEIKTGDQSKFIPTDATEKYRYWRYLSPWDSYGNIAELEFYERGSEIPSKGKVIGTLYPYHGDEQWGYEKAFDGDWLTYASSDLAHFGWFGIDFGRPVNIEKFRCIPRSDDNGIRTGDEYELFYWNNHQWCSVGEKTGETDILKFENIPENALLLLKNHTRGKQERIFTYENDQQVWW